MDIFKQPLPFKLSLETAQDDYLCCEKLLREVPGKRLVFRGLWQERPIIAKLFLDPNNAQRHWSRERKGVEAIAGTSVPTPLLLFAGQLTDGTFVLVFEFLHKAQTALERWSLLRSEDSRFAFLCRLSCLVGELHAAGLVQKDLHLENFLVAQEKIYAVDGDAVCTAKHGKPLPLGPSSRNLALLLAQFSPKHDHLLEKAALCYAKQRNISGSVLQELLSRDLPQVRRHRRLKYVKKSYRTCSEFVCLKQAGQLSISRRDVQGDALHELLLHPDHFMSKGQRLKDGNSSTVVRVQGKGFDWVVKRYNIKSFLHAMSRCLRPTRAWTSWGNAHRLQITGIETPRAVAIIEKRIGPLRYTGYYICDFVEGSNSEDFFQDASLADADLLSASERFVDLFTLFRRLGIHHGDCKATNFLLRNNIPWVLDLDAMYECSSSRRFKKLYQVDRRRFLRNWQNKPALQKWFDTHLPK